jgi:hypothetical protein
MSCKNKTPSNITLFGLCNILKILKIGAHKVAGQSVRQPKIFISGLGVTFVVLEISQTLIMIRTMWSTFTHY